MKRLLYILGVLVLTLNAISCRDCYYIENDLHGVWQVTSVERLSTGEVKLARGKLYYSFQRTMVMLGYKYSNVPEEGMENYISHFDFITQDSIGMGYFRVSTSGESGKDAYEQKIPLETLHKFGIYQDYTMFRMELSKQNLILTSDSARIVCRRY